MSQTCHVVTGFERMPPGPYRSTAPSTNRSQASVSGVSWSGALQDFFLHPFAHFGVPVR